MKLLFMNQLETATLSALGTNPNYGADNLKSNLLRKRWQSYSSSDIISIEWSTAISLDAIYTGYTNAEGVEILAYQGSSLVYQQWATRDGEEYTGREFTDGSAHFFAVSDPTGHYPGSLTGITKVELRLASTDSSPVYLGGVGVGSAVEVSPNTDFVDTLWDNSESEGSAFGQSSQFYIEPGDERTMTFTNLTYVTFDTLKRLFQAKGAGGHMWVDFFEESHEQYPAQYCITTGINSANRAGKIYTLVSTFREAR